MSSDYQSRAASVPHGYDVKGWKRNVTDNSVYNYFPEVRAAVVIKWWVLPFIPYYGFIAEVTVTKSGRAKKFKGDTVVQCIEQAEGFIAMLILERD